MHTCPYPPYIYLYAHTHTHNMVALQRDATVNFIWRTFLFSVEFPTAYSWLVINTVLIYLSVELKPEPSVRRVAQTIRHLDFYSLFRTPDQGDKCTYVHYLIYILDIWYKKWKRRIIFQNTMPSLPPTNLPTNQLSIHPSTHSNPNS